MDNRENRAAVFNQETVIGAWVLQGRIKLQDDKVDVSRLPEAWRARCWALDTKKPRSHVGGFLGR